MQLRATSATEVNKDYDNNGDDADKIAGLHG
jgi:hypothetical protein